ncbi:putative reverse transcriptase domain-containing protein, partial [Tanacetum coccineum]
IMPPKAMTQAAIEKLVSDRVVAALAQDRVARGNTNGASGPDGNIRGNARGKGGTPPARECNYSSFMKCNPTSFHENEGVVELCCWFEKTESVFSICECAERNKVKFAAATLQGRALTWWNSQVATLGFEVVNAMYWNDMKIMMREELFNELVLLCPEMVPSKKKKVEAYLRGLPENIKGETTSSRLFVLNECPPKCYNCGKMGHKEKDCRSKNVASSTNARSAVVCYECRERGHESNACPKRADRQGGNVRGQAYVICDAEHNQGPNVVTVTFLLNNHYVTILFDSGADKSFVDVRLSHLLDIKPAKLTSYEVELADGKVVCTNTVLKGCSLNLLDHLFDIDLMPIELEPSKKQLQDVPVIRNFPEVFPDDLPGLPPSRPRSIEGTIRERVYSPFSSPWRAPQCCSLRKMDVHSVPAYTRRIDLWLVIIQYELEKKISLLQLFGLGSYEHYKGVVAEVEHSKPGFELQGAKMVEMGRFG